jgi:hypothetical protein
MKGSSGMEKKTEVSLIKENDDGSADYMFNLPPESMAAFARLGIMTAIQAGLDGAKRYEPDNEEVPAMDANIKRLAIEAGFIAWDEEEWKPEGAVFDWVVQMTSLCFTTWYAKKLSLRSVKPVLLLVKTTKHHGQKPNGTMPVLGVPKSIRGRAAQ